MLTRIALGVVCFFGLTFATLLLFYAGSPWIEQRAIPFFGSRFYDSVLFGIAGLFCVYVNIRLIQGKAWAWWTALTANVLTLALGVLIFISALHPRDDFARSESGFGIGISVILVAPTAIATILLILPPVRRRFGFSRSTRAAIQV
jgi:hypothetical protein